MPGTCVIGLQWGDEAKGKIVDLLTEQHDIVVRYQGGANAGHTVVTEGQTYKLSLIPSGILRSGVQCVITGGVVLNPPSILGEIDSLTPAEVKGLAAIGVQEIDVSNLTGAGPLTIDGGITLAISGAVPSNETITFAGTGGALPPPPGLVHEAS